MSASTGNSGTCIWIPGSPHSRSFKGLCRKCSIVDQFPVLLFLQSPFILLVHREFKIMCGSPSSGSSHAKTLWEAQHEGLVPNATFPVASCYLASTHTAGLFEYLLKVLVCRKPKFRELSPIY